MFGLNQSKAKIASLTSRIQFHGDERVPAADIKLSVDVPSDALDGISTGLCASLFRQPTSGDQVSLIDRKAAEAFTALRHPGLAPQQLKAKFPGYEIELGEGVGEDYQQLAFSPDSEPKNFTITPRDGGTATVEFTVSLGEVDDDDFIILRTMQTRGEAIVTLTPPTTKRQSEPETCESGDPECGPVEHHDADGTPLCKRCYDALETTSTDPDDGEEADQQKAA